MRNKIISLVLFILIWINTAIAAENYTISAIVGNSNRAPVVTEYLPATETIYLAYSVIWTLVKQNYSIKFRDDENDEVTYTVTPETDWWTITIDNWTILTGDYDWNNEAYIFFEYIAPYSAVWAKTITVTINDGSNVTIKTLNVYIY